MKKTIILITLILMTTALFVYIKTDGFGLADMPSLSANEVMYLIQETIINSISRMVASIWCH